MSAGAAIGAAAAANAAAANARAIQAERIACEAFLQAFDPRAASVADKQRYARCVEVVHPTPHEPLHGGELIAAKAGVGLLILLLLAGAAYGWRDDGPLMAFVMALMFPLTGALVALVGVGVLVGIVFIFGASA